MGNCIRKGSAAEWGGDDWGSFGKSSSEDRVQESSLVGEGKGVLCCELGAATEVKIKISKKELERLVKKAEIEGLSMHQVLAQLVDVSDCFEAHQRSWSPALQSIPE